MTPRAPLSPIRVSLTGAQLSALQCRMHGAEQVDGLTVRGDRLIVRDREGAWRALQDASNAEDDWALANPRDPGAPFARRAARSLECVARKVAALSPNPQEEPYG